MDLPGGMGAMGHAVMWGKWVDARFEKPDADIMVLGYYAPSECWWLASWDGENWLDADSNVPRRVSHWMHLPEGPEWEKAEGRMQNEEGGGWEE